MNKEDPSSAFAQASGSPMSLWRSCAEWPADAGLCCDLVSKDEHHSEYAAQCVCNTLMREGFGGNRRIFPVRVWTERIESENHKDYPTNVGYQSPAHENRQEGGAK